MPTFDFKCTACQTVFEEKIPFGSKDFPPCPACKKPSEKLISPPLGIMFKGQGFYKTDSSTRPKTLKKEEKANFEQKKVDSPASAPSIETSSTSDSNAKNGSND